MPRGDGGIVEIAETAIQVCGGVMAGRAAQGIGASFARDDAVGGGQRALCAPIGGRPRPGENGAAGPVGVQTGAAIHALRTMPDWAGGKCLREDRSEERRVGKECRSRW